MKGTRDKPNPSSVQGKVLIFGLFGALACILGFLFWTGVNGGSTHVPLSPPGVGFTADPVAGDAAATEPEMRRDAGSLTATVAARAARDALRAKILAQWASAKDPEVATEARQGRFVPAPVGPDGQAMDPKYIQELVRADFIPMAGKCYEHLLSKRDAGGRVALSFTIVADEKLGGIVEDATVDSDGGLAEEAMTTCLRESLSTLVFRPPAHGGVVTVVYPIEFSPDDDAGP